MEYNRNHKLKIPLIVKKWQLIPNENKQKNILTTNSKKIKFKNMKLIMSKYFWIYLNDSSFNLWIKFKSFKVYHCRLFVQFWLFRWICWNVVTSILCKLPHNAGPSVEWKIVWGIYDRSSVRWVTFLIRSQEIGDGQWISWYAL